MKCEEAGERITALVDGELPPAEREELERHLSGCAACREARAAEEAVAARLRAAPRPALPAGFADSVMAKVGTGAAPGKPAGRILPLWPLLAVASAVAAAIVAMVTVGPGERKAGPVMTASKPAPKASALPAAELNERLDAEEKPAGAKFAEVPEEEALGNRDAAPAAAAPVPGAQEPSPDAGMVAATEKKADKEAEKKPEVPKAEADEVRRDKAKDAPAQTRIVFQYRVPVLVEAQQSVESTLMANKSLATRSGAWLVPSQGNFVQEQNRVLLLQIRPENLAKLRAVLDQGLGLRDSSVELLDRGEVLPPEVARLLAGAADGKAKEMRGREAAGPPPSGGLGESRAGAGAEEEPGPPPKPSAEQLKRLAEPPPPSREGPTTVTGEAAEVLVEIRLETVPPPKPTPAGGK